MFYSDPSLYGMSVRTPVQATPLQANPLQATHPLQAGPLQNLPIQGQWFDPNLMAQRAAVPSHLMPQAVNDPYAGIVAQPTQAKWANWFTHYYQNQPLAYQAQNLIPQVPTSQVYPLQATIPQTPIAAFVPQAMTQAPINFNPWMTGLTSIRP